jgi:hypothetical protein
LAAGPPDISDSARPTAQSNSLQDYTRLPTAAIDAYKEQRRVHQINLDYPSASPHPCFMQLTNKDPYIWIVRDFLSPAECDRLVAEYAVSANEPSATFAEQAETRTSTTVVPPPAKVAWLQERFCKILNVDLSQLDPTKLSHYAEKQFFGSHGDWAGTAHAFKYNRLFDAIGSLDENASEAEKLYKKGLEDSGLGKIPDRFVSMFVRCASRTHGNLKAVDNCGIDRRDGRGSAAGSTGLPE